MAPRPSVPLLVVVVLLLGACSTSIQHGLDEAGADELVSALVGRGFQARKVPEAGKRPTWAVEVEDAQASDALQVLAALGLPRPPRATTRGVMDARALIETPGAERLRQVEAQEGDLEEALERVDGVTAAAVELVVPAAPRPGSAASPSRASVLLKVRGEALESLGSRRAELRALVAGGVEGLAVDDVVLVMDAVTLQPRVAEARPGDLRGLVGGLAAALSLAAGLLVALAFRLARARRPGALASPAPAPGPTPSRPVVSPGVQRKVA